jgi:hypothetical protein
MYPRTVAADVDSVTLRSLPQGTYFQSIVRTGIDFANESRKVLTNSPVARSPGPRALFFSGTIITIAVLLLIQRVGVGEWHQALSPIFFVLFVSGDFWATAAELLILGAAVFIAAKVPARTVLRAAGEHPGTIAAITAVVLCAGALFVYHDHPLSMDEYAAYFQSQVFATGHITGQFPVALKDWLIPPNFQDYFLQVSHANGRVASAYWPGHALIMAPFALLGAPWACNPVLTALTLLVIHRLALHMFEDVEAAGLALLLTIASPVIFGNGISYYSMPAHLLANSLYALLLVRPAPQRCAAAGLVGSIALCLHNPVPHTLFAMPWFIWVATRPGGIRLLALLCAGYLPLSLLLGVGWFEFSNHLRSEGRENPLIMADANRLRAMLSLFSPPTASVLMARLIALAKVWVWAVPGLLVLAAYAAARWYRNPLCRLFAASALITLTGYVFFPLDQGHGWGYRYFHSAWMALPLLATAAVFRPVRAANPTTDKRAGLFEDTDTRQFVATCALLTLVFGVGWRAWQIQDFTYGQLTQMPRYSGTERRVIIIDGHFSFYGADLVQNDPWLRGNVILMYSHGAAEDAKMMAQYFPDMHEVAGDPYGTIWSTARLPVNARNEQNHSIDRGAP